MKKFFTNRTIIVIVGIVLLVNLFQVDLDDLSWVTNRWQYINIIIATIIIIATRFRKEK